MQVKILFGGNTYSGPKTTGNSRGRKIILCHLIIFSNNKMQRIKFHFYLLLISRLLFKRYVTYLLENEEFIGDFQLIGWRLSRHINVCRN